MIKTKKECVPVSVRINVESYDELKYVCNETGISKTAAIERAIQMYAADYRKRQELIASVEK